MGHKRIFSLARIALANECLDSHTCGTGSGTIEAARNEEQVCLGHGYNKPRAVSPS